MTCKLHCILATPTALILALPLCFVSDKSIKNMIALNKIVTAPVLLWLLQPEPSLIP